MHLIFPLQLEHSLEGVPARDRLLKLAILVDGAHIGHIPVFLLQLRAKGEVGQCLSEQLNALGTDGVIHNVANRGTICQLCKTHRASNTRSVGRVVFEVEGTVRSLGCREPW
jgi:hypothetical protein